jgi:hypothetical protein
MLSGNMGHKTSVDKKTWLVLNGADAPLISFSTELPNPAAFTPHSNLPMPMR